MALPKLVYDDFYKFLMSLGIILFIISLVPITQGWFLSDKILILLWIILLFSIRMMLWAGSKWYRNQKLYDEQTILKTEKLKTVSTLPPKQERRILEIRILAGIKNFIVDKIKYIVNKIKKDKSGIALVKYKIASSFSDLNTKSFNFLTDWQVWFLIENHERKRYRAYIKIKFISDDYEEDAKDGYYGGAKAWKLNALDRIVAPGLTIPPEIREKAEQKKKIEIRIFCEIKDESDELIEKKLPVGYVYDYENNSWYYEP